MNPGQDPSVEIMRLHRQMAELEEKLALAALGAGLQSALDGLFEGVQIVDPGYRYVYVKRTAAEHGRRTREELVGRTMSEMYPGIEETKAFEVLSRCMADRQPRHLVNWFTFPDQAKAWFDLRFNPVPQGVLILSVDVSEMKAMEEQILRSREALAITLECMADGVVTADPEGRVVQLNPAAEALLGWTAKEARGKPLDDVVRLVLPGADAPAGGTARRILDGDDGPGLAPGTRLAARDGAPLPVGGSGAPLRDEDGLLRGVVLVLRRS